MSIIVRPISQKIKLEITTDEEKVVFTYVQLSYRIKNLIAGFTTSVKQGQVVIDTALTCFYHVKYALKDVTGLTNVDGSPYMLTFEDDKKEALTDACVDEILALPFNNKIIFASKELLNSIPKEIVNPITGKKLEGVELVLDDNIGLKKTS